LNKSFIDVGEIDFHLENDVHQPLNRLSVHLLHPNYLSSRLSMFVVTASAR
jgi:hypothetical protein